ncbi:PQQ-dependent sugar dehydrogenase [Alteromonas sp. C1M14]|uniref:PQQ-dependent sugar dehydrogenase n=1 Tax=Alteromonas sp. C1M14 TaxID=2841567 RepID=UPI001C097093|nr:PQQ-dependent sugar dehydrogenase [Alteromonas sp. C1M14]MBU2977645.1 PQQ-dependent sugar dehydrogenase [Alteromonas sp. C1M14]
MGICRIVGFMLLWSLFGVADAKQVDEIHFQAKRIAPARLQSPWALVQLPDERWLITEREGNLVLLGEHPRVTRIPLDLPALYYAGQGGLLDVALTQDFPLSGRILLTFSQGTGDKNHLAVATAVLENDQVHDLKVIFSVTPDKDTPVHFGGRLAVMNDGTWLVTTGDGFDFREQAQKRTSQLGKILRIREDGQAPKDNPFADAPFVFSYGHRNPQGLVIDEQHNKIYAHEHGPDGGDEINLIQPASNYGWPVATQGLDYSGARISPFTSYEGMVEPLFNWSPSVAPSSMILYQGSLFPTLDGQLLVTTLKAQTLIAVDIGAKPVHSREIFATIMQKARLRDIAVGNDGAIYILTDGENATVFRIAPLK